MTETNHWGKLFQHAIPKSYVKRYPKFSQIAQEIDRDDEISQLWACCNVMAIERQKINDHGVGHVRTVLKHAIQIFELLVAAGVQPSICKHYNRELEDALVVVLLASTLHDIGHVVSRKNHGTYSLSLCKPIIERLLMPHYTVRPRTIVFCETLHAMYSHMGESQVSTLEGGIIRLADALDIKEGRAMEAIKLGKIDIHSISSSAIQSVTVARGKEHPIHIYVEMTSSAGIFQIDSLLKRKLHGSGLLPYVSLYAQIVGEHGDSPVKEYRINV